MRKLFLFTIMTAFPVYSFAAAITEESIRTFGWRVAMFVIFATLLYFILRKPVKAMLTQRTEDIKSALAEAELAKEEAQKKVKEYEAKMEQLKKELEVMKENVKKTAEAERQQMIDDAKKQVEQMKQFAVNMIDAEKERAIVELHNEAVELAAAEAEKKLVKDISGSKADKILDEYVKRIGE